MNKKAIRKPDVCKRKIIRQPENSFGQIYKSYMKLDVDCKYVYHRRFRPARISIAGDKEYYVNGKIHRLFWPAIKTIGHGKAWYKKGKRHNFFGPAIKTETEKKWYLNNKLHRIGKPASIRKEHSKYEQYEWWEFGYMHRLDGNSMIYKENNKIKLSTWHIHGISLTQLYNDII